MTRDVPLRQVVPGPQVGFVQLEDGSSGLDLDLSFRVVVRANVVEVKRPVHVGAR